MSLAVLLERAAREPHQITDQWFTGTRRWAKSIAVQAKTYPGRVDAGTFEDYEVAKAGANAALRALNQLRQSVDQFADDLFINKGLWQPDGQNISKNDRKFGGIPKVWKEKSVDAVKTAREAVSDARSRVEYMLAGLNPDKGDFRWDARFHADQAGWDLALKSMGIAIDDAADAVYEAIDKLLKALSKVYNMRSGLEPWEPGGGPGVPDVVEVSGAKLIFDPLPDPTRAMRMEPGEGYIEPRVRERYVAELLKAKALLTKRGVGFLWYGNFFAKPKGEAPENHLGAHFGTGANYWIARDEVNIFVMHSNLHVLVAHELGHRLWFKFLTQSQRAGFERSFGDVKAVSEYGGTNAEEDFAEVFAHYIDGRDMTRDQIERFKSFVTGKWKMENLSEELESALVEVHNTAAMTRDSEEEIDGHKVVYFYSASGGDKEWAFTIDGVEVSKGYISHRFRAQEAAKKAVKSLKTRRDSSNGQYKHSGGFDRMCRCGHRLGDHSDAQHGGVRTCFACEQEGKEPADHKFVAVKQKEQT